jgi:hypothetical protein
MRLARGKEDFLKSELGADLPIKTALALIPPKRTNANQTPHANEVLGANAAGRGPLMEAGGKTMSAGAVPASISPSQADHPPGAEASVDSLPALGDVDAVDNIERASSAQDEACLEVGDSDLGGERRGSRVDGEIDLIDRIAATAEKLAAVEMIGDGIVERLDAAICGLSEIRDRWAPAAWRSQPRASASRAAFPVRPRKVAQNEPVQDYDLYIALNVAWGKATLKARRWFLSDMRRDPQQLADHGLDLVEKKPENQASEATEVDLVVETTDSDAGRRSR